VQLAVRVDVENPRVLIESLSKFSGPVMVEAINVKLNNANDLVVVVCSRGHGLPLVICGSR
jgi:hypothetical protein